MKGTLYEHFVGVSFELAPKEISDYAHPFSKKTYRQSQHLTLLLLKRFNRWAYRATEEQVKAHPSIRALLGLRSTPDHSTLQKFHARLEESVLESLFQAILQRVKKTLTGKRPDFIGRR